MKNSKSSNNRWLNLQQNFLQNKGATLVLIWSSLSFTVYHYFAFSGSRDRFKLSPGEILAIGLILPIGGWLADAFFGRYRVIRFGMRTMWFGAIMNGLSLVIGEVSQTYHDSGDQWVSFVCKVIMGAGLGAFQANIVQFGIDQLMDASSAEIKSFTVWYTITLFGCGISFALSSWCAPQYIPVLVVSVSLTLAVISNFLLNHWLNKEQIVQNPLPLILNVVQLSIKSKFTKRGSFMMEYKGWLSKLNVAKRVYNGPYSSEQVEDVKTFIRVMFVMAVFFIACSGLPSIDNAFSKLPSHLLGWPSGKNIRECTARSTFYFFSFISAFVVMLLYQIFINPLFHGFIPKFTILSKFYISVFFSFASIMALLGIETVAYLMQKEFESNETIVRCIFKHDHYVTNVAYYWVILPYTLHGLSILLFIISAIEFVCAQAPYNMKGLILGLGCALFGLSSLIQAVISKLFLHSTIWERAPLTCGIWYFLLQGVIVLVGFFIVLAIVKTYKQRQRVNAERDWQESDSYTE